MKRQKKYIQVSEKVKYLLKNLDSNKLIIIPSLYLVLVFIGEYRLMNC